MIRNIKLFLCLTALLLPSAGVGTASERSVPAIHEAWRNNLRGDTKLCTCVSRVIGGSITVDTADR
jgi:hypothetical protein